MIYRAVAEKLCTPGTKTELNINMIKVKLVNGCTTSLSSYLLDA